jgi:uncharacterized repeat protein (TIGR01451 family)
VRRCGLVTAVFVLTLARCGARADGPAEPAIGGRVIIATSTPAPAIPPGTASSVSSPGTPVATLDTGNVPPAAPAPGRPRSRLIIATSARPSVPPRPIVPVPDDGLQLVPVSPAPAKNPAPPPRPAGLQLTAFQAPVTGPELTAPPGAAGASPRVAEAAPPATPQGQTASLSVEKKGPPVASRGQPFTYAILVRNPGEAPVRGVKLRDELPAGARCVRSEPPALGNGPALEWDLDTLAPGAERKVQVEVQMDQADRFQDVATVCCSIGQACGTEIREAQPEAALPRPKKVERGAVPALALHVTGRDSLLEIGAETTCEIRASNQGGGALSSVRVEAALPEGFVLTGAEPAHRVEGRRVVFEPVARLAGREDQVFRVHLKARAAGDWRLRTSVTCDQLRQPVTQEGCVRVYDGGDEAAPALVEEAPKRQQ